MNKCASYAYADKYSRCSDSRGGFLLRELGQLASHYEEYMRRRWLDDAREQGLLNSWWAGNTFHVTLPAIYVSPLARYCEYGAEEDVERNKLYSCRDTGENCRTIPPLESGL